MVLRVDLDLSTTPSRQIVEQVLDAVAAGRLAPGARLPTVRDAAAQALVNPNTVARAWRDLESLGVVQGRPGAGVFVTTGAPEIARRERRKATLGALRVALHEALRSGHAPDVVAEETRRAIERVSQGATTEPRHARR